MNILVRIKDYTSDVNKLFPQFSLLLEQLLKVKLLVNIIKHLQFPVSVNAVWMKMFIVNLMELDFARRAVYAVCCIDNDSIQTGEQRAQIADQFHVDLCLFGREPLH